MDDTGRIEVHLRIDADSLTLDDMIDLDGASNLPPLRQAREVLRRFVTDAEGNYLAAEEAEIAVGRLTLRQVKEALDQLTACFKELGDTAVNPTTGGA